MSMTTEALGAWRAEVAGGQQLLFWTLSAAGYVTRVPTLLIPGSEPPFTRLGQWQTHWIPVLDGRDDCLPHMLVLHVMRQQDVRWLGIPLEKAPRPVTLTDAQFTGFDAGACGHWAEAAISGIRDGEVHLPIIDPDRLFGLAFLDHWRAGAETGSAA
ncbi:hypothetical protein AAIA72_16425 [Hahella sp. SMD15-11]|uniref:Chemotaxis protein CheW n=1 Tax=Thermohahella caldifontis TaxID=3142973 RepID=A0AB39UWL3_9GAMM